MKPTATTKFVSVSVLPRANKLFKLSDYVILSTVLGQWSPTLFFFLTRKYSRTCPCDHLKIADTQFQSPQFADANVRSALLKMRPPEKCKLRTPKVGPKHQFNLQKATTFLNLSEKHFFDCLPFPSQPVRTSDHRVCKLRLAWSLPITPPLTRGNHRSLMPWFAQGYVYNSILKSFEPNLANETTGKIGPLIPSPVGGRNSQV